MMMMKTVALNVYVIYAQKSNSLIYIYIIYNDDYKIYDNPFIGKRAIKPSIDLS